MFTEQAVAAEGLMQKNTKQYSSHEGTSLMAETARRLLPAAAGIILLTNAHCALANPLPEVVLHTLQTNPTIRSAQENLMAVKQSYYEARSGFLPSIDVAVAKGREKTESPSLLSQGVNSKWLTRRESSLSISQPIYTGGQTINQVQQQSYAVKSAQAQVLAEAEEVVHATVDAYLNVLRHTRLIELAEENLAIHKVTLRLVEQRFSGGAGHRADIELIEARLALAQARVISSRGSRRVAQARYYAITGINAENLQLPQVPYYLLPKSTEHAVELARHQSPLLRAAMHNVTAARKGTSALKSAFRPQIQLDLSSSNNRNTDGTTGHNKDKLVMLRASFNLFRGGADQARLVESRHRAIESEQTMLELQRSVTELVQTSWIDFNTSVARLVQLREYVTSTSEVVNAYKQQFKLGKRLLLNVLDSENENYSATVDRVNGEFDVAINAYAVFANIGNLVPVVIPSWSSNVLSKNVE